MDYLFYFLYGLLAIVTLMMWYFYGAIDSINDDTLEKKKDRYSKRLLKFIDNYHTKLIVCVLIYSFVTVYLMSRHPYGWAFVILLLFLSVLSKHVGYSRAENMNPFLFSVSYVFYTLILPVTFLIVVLIDVTARLIHLDIRHEYESVTEEEIISIVNDGHEQGVLEEEEARMISNIVELGDKEAMDIMTHRKNVVALNEDLTLAETAELISAEKFSRYPVYREELDHIVGILHLRDFFKTLQTAGAERDMHLSETTDLIRPAYFVPTTKNVNEIFKEMQETKTHMAMVIDEYGQLDGILAMEDIIEEIMGNILDEYDVDETQFIDQGNGRFVARGTCPLDLLADKLEIDFGEEFETLNGFLISRLNRIPKDDENSRIDVPFSGWNFRILKVRNKMVQLVKIIKLQETESEEE